MSEDDGSPMAGRPGADVASPADGENRCRSCGSAALWPVLDLGLQPLANEYPAPTDTTAEQRWPLRVGVCADCLLVQLLGSVPTETEVPGSAPAAHSTTMRDHDARFVDELASLHAAGGGNGRIVEVASHGGYLHDYFVERGLDSLVVEGAPALVEDLRSRGVPVVAENLGLGSVDRVRGGGPGASIVVDSYFLAHVQDPNDLMAGMRGVLAPGGRVVLEFDHVLPVIIEGQFDALRHGHLTYWSLHALDKLLRRHGLAAGSVTEQPVYGGALRVIAGAVETTSTGESVYRVLEAERAAGLDRMETYAAFEANVKRAIDRVHEFLLAERAAGRIVVGYGAPSRGATLLNAARVTPDLLPFTVDRSPVKQGRLMPGCRIPIAAPDRLREVMPDAVLILTWDIRDEVIDQQAELRAHGVHFVVAVPTLEVVAG